ncbi:MAG: DUF4445 domain-containing protein, partial [Nitrospinae bacterium]|nr:DUF4445 domain-containing protein [Nitrospinota bacterium]
MNGLERVRAVIRGQPTDRPPVIPELFGVTAVLAGVPVRSYFTDAEVLARCQLDARARFGHDALFAMADLCVEAEALGSRITFPEGNYPHVTTPALDAVEGFARLSLPDPHKAGRMPELLRATRLLVKEARGEAPVFACVTGPITLAARTLDIEKMLYAIVDTPETFAVAVDFCRKVAERFMLSLLEAGADGIMIFDPIASPAVLPERIFARFEEGAVRSLFAAAKAFNRETITWYSVAGPIHTNQSLFTELAPDILTIDYMVPLDQALERAYPVVINGNIKPNLFIDGTPEEIREEAARLLATARTSERFILGSGCEVPLNATEANIHALMEAVRDETGSFTRMGDRGAVEVTILPHRIKTSIPAGGFLLDAIHQADVSITSYCNRSGSCGRCTALVLDGAVSPPEEIEKHQLATRRRHGLEVTKEERLTCLTRPVGPVTIYLPQENRVRRQYLPFDRVGLDRSMERLFALYGFDPLVSLAPLDKASPGVSPPPERVARRLERFRQQGAERLYAVMNRLDDVILDVTDTPHILGLCVDIGTTSLTGYVVDLANGEIKCVGMLENMQMSWGADVISRADAARDPETLRRLQESLIEGINRLLKTFRRDHDIEERQIYAMTVVGNPVIIHLFFGLNPGRLAQAPFTSSIAGRLSVTADSLGGDISLGVNRRCLVTALPSVQGFVGADTVAGVLATGMGEDERPSLLLDIGTNGEMVLGGRDRLVCASVASGPVFEGAHLQCAVGYQRGGITSLAIGDDGNVNYTTAGGGAPIGLCGSSIIDLIAELIRHRLVDARGHFLPRNGWPHLTEKHLVITERENT